MNDVLINALDDCLRAVEAGASLESALGRYPDLAAELRPLLLAAQAARPAEPLRVPRQSETASRTRFLARAQSLRAARRPGGWLANWGLSLRSALLAGVLLLAGILSTAGLVSASAQSLPGDALYGLKRGVENVQLSLAPDAAARAALTTEFERRRLAEVEAVTAQHRSAAVVFTGQVEAQAGEQWHVAGVTVIVPAGLGGGVSVGQWVEVAGRTQTDGSVRADQITPRGSAPLPTASPTAPAPSLQPPATATPELSVTASAEPSETEDIKPQASPTSKAGSSAASRTPKPGSSAASSTPKSGSGGPAASSTPKSGGSGPAPTQTPKPDDKQPTTAPATATPEPTRTARPPATSEAKPSETATETHEEQTRTPEPTQTREPESLDFEGQVEAVGSVWIVAGKSLVITAETDFKDNPQLGDQVKVRAWRLGDGTLVARQIEKH